MSLERSLLNFTVSYWNIEGIHDKTHGCKIEYLNKFLCSDIEILYETWGDCDHFSNVENYHAIKIEANKNKQTKKGRSSGGLLIFFKHYLSKFLIVKKCSENYVWIEIDKKFFTKLDDNILLCIAYNPPVNSQYYKDDLIEDIRNDILDLTCNHSTSVMIIGDFNARIGNLQDYDCISNPNNESPLSTSTNPQSKRNACDVQKF